MSDIIKSSKIRSNGQFTPCFRAAANNYLTAAPVAALLVDPAVARQHVETALWAAQQAAALTRYLSGGETNEPLRPVDLNCLARRSARIWASVFGPRITLVTRLAKNAPPVMADEAQLLRLIMNLVINAAESYEGERDRVELITAVTEVTTLDDDWHFFTETFSPGLYVCLTVADEGEGMDAATLEQIFAPFYSTKAARRGLGLSAAQSILRRHRGAVRVASEPGRGSVFHLLFPAAADAPLPLPEEEENEFRPPGEGNLVLIGEDEKVIRQSLVEALRLAGCRPLPASDSSAALARFTAAPQEIDLAILDVTMPGLSGPELYGRMRRLRPDLPVIFLSGQREPAFLQNLDAEKVRFLRKPYDIHALIAEVNQLLGKEDAD